MPASRRCWVTSDNGRWLLAPTGTITRQSRRYRPGTLVLETEFETADGAVRIVDCMPIRDRTPDVVRIVEGLRGRVPMHMELVLRFDYGSIVPWVVRRVDRRLRATAGPDSVRAGDAGRHPRRGLPDTGRLHRAAGETVPFLLRWHLSHEPPPPPIDVAAAVADTEEWWMAWSGRAELRRQRPLARGGDAVPHHAEGAHLCPDRRDRGRRHDVVAREDRRCPQLGLPILLAARRHLHALLADAGRLCRRGHAWRDWLLRAVAGEPSKLQIMYGPAGERRLDEFELPHLAGYESSRPVRIGNAASGQFQLDVYGEVMDAMHQGRRAGMTDDGGFGWALQCALMDFLETAWTEPDEGIWEVRGPRRHFTHSKVMAWVAVDRAVRATERFDCQGPVDRWRRLRDEIHAEVCAKGFDTDRNMFTQYYGSTGTDASLLMMPLVGFLPASDRARAGHRRRRAARAHDARGLRHALRPRQQPASTGFRRARGASSPARSGSPTI